MAPHRIYASLVIYVILAGMDGDSETGAKLAHLAALLRTSKQFPFAAKTGEILGSAFPAATAVRRDTDALLAKLQQRYRTPIPEAYLSETIAKQQGQRRQHGVFYTPWPLAHYLMRSAAEIVTQEFPGASPSYLDPACGGGIFYHARSRVHAAADFRAWDNSEIAIELAKAICKAHGESAEAEPTFELRDALQLEPAGSDWEPNSQPLVVVGNPPYSNFGKRTLSPWLADKMRAYRPAQAERKTNLRDAFLLFFRLAESLIRRRGQGVIAMVLSTTFLDAITHSQVRASLRSTFDELRILRLQSEADVEGENLFSIRHPTAACVFIRRTGGMENRQGRVWRAELAGSRDEKLTWLEQSSVSTTTWTEVSTSDLVAEQGRGGWGSRAEAPSWYANAPGLNEIFREYISGVQTKNDSLFLARTRNELEIKIHARFDCFDASLVQPILVGPFDPWWIYYDPALLGRARYSALKHMLRENVGLVFMRQATGAGEYDHFLVTRHLVTDRVLHSRWGAPFLGPLYVWDQEVKASNVDSGAPEDWLAFVYALVQSKQYRSRAGESLRRDYPRIPHPSQFPIEISQKLTALGRQLIELHAPQEGFASFRLGDETPTSFQLAARYPQTEPSGEDVMVHTGRDQCLAKISREAWHYRIGGVEVLRRFLMRRRGKSLLSWEVDHFRDVARRLGESTELRAEIDAMELAPVVASEGRFAGEHGTLE